MTAGGRPWQARLTAAAEADFEDILRSTIGRFGEVQARNYAETLSRALEALAGGPNVIGAKARDDIGKRIFTLHATRQGRRGRHFVVFRIGHDKGREVIEVLRLLHDPMELPRHLPAVDETGE